MQFKRNDGTEVDVEYTVVSYGSPAAWTSYGGDPAEPPEIEIDVVTDEDGNDVVLTDDERERIEGEIAEIVQLEAPDDFYDE